MFPMMHLTVFFNSGYNPRSRIALNCHVSGKLLTKHSEKGKNNISLLGEGGGSRPEKPVITGGSSFFYKVFKTFVHWTTFLVNSSGIEHSSFHFMDSSASQPSSKCQRSCPWNQGQSCAKWQTWQNWYLFSLVSLFHPFSSSDTCSTTLSFAPAV